MGRRRVYNIKAVVVALIIIVLVILSVFYLFRFMTGEKKNWIEIESTSAQIKREVKGLVITDALIYKSYNTGIVRDSVEESQIIKNGALIGTFVCSKDASLEEVSVEKKEDISKIKLSKSAVLNLVEEDFEKLKTALVNSDREEAKKLKIDLKYNLDFLKKLSNDENFEFDNVSDVPIKMIGSKNAKIDEEFKLVSAESGYLSYYVDAFDGILSYDGRYGFKYDEIFETSAQPVSTFGKYISPNQVAFKVIAKEKWHLLLNMKIEDLDKFVLEGKINLKFLGKQVVGIVVDKYKTQGNGILAVEVDVFHPDFFKSRIVDVDIELDEVVGIKIPVAAVEFNADGEKGVYVSTVDGDEIFRIVEVIEEVAGDNEERFYVVTPNVITTVDDAGNTVSVDTVSVGDKVLVKVK